MLSSAVVPEIRVYKSSILSLIDRIEGLSFGFGCQQEAIISLICLIDGSSVSGNPGLSDNFLLLIFFSQKKKGKKTI